MKRIVYIIMALVVLTAGCSRRPSDARLLRAEALIDSMPAEVLASLDSLDPATLSSRGDRALYALLLTKARDKNYIFDKDDSLITMAVDYFTSSGDDRRLMQALFYQGQVKYNADSLVAAMPCLLAALDLAAARDDYFMQGKCHELIGLMYFFHYNQDKALSHSRQAAEYYTTAGKDFFALYSKLRVAVGLSNSGKYKESLALLDSLAPLVQDKDSYTKAVHYAFNLNPLCFLDEGKAALDTLKKLIELYPSPLSGVYDYGHVAHVYISAGLLDSAEIYIRKYRETPNIVYSDVIGSYLSQLLASKRADYKNAYHYARSEIKYSNEKTKYDFINALAFAERDYYRTLDLRNEESTRNKMLRLYYIGAIILVIFIAAGVYIILIRRKKEKEARLWAAEAQDYFTRLKQSEESHSGAVSALNTKEGELSRARNMIETLYLNQFNVINEISRSVYENQSNSANHTDHRIASALEEAIANLNNEAFIRKIKETVGSRFGDKVEDIIKTIGFNQKEELMIWLMAVRFSPNTVCLFMKLSKSNYYTLRSRIIRKITESDLPDKTQIVKDVLNYV